MLSRHMPHWAAAVAAISIVAAVQSWAALSAAETGADVTVDLASGRSFTAAIDPRTDDEWLWLRFQSPFGTVLRPVAWQRVVSARLADRSLTGAELRQAAPELVSQPPESARAPELAPRGSASYAGASRREPVRSMHVEAVVANWDTDVEMDGLIVSIAPLDDSGRLVPVEGSLQAILLAERYSPDDGWRPDRLGRWSRGVHAGDFAAHGAEYRLEFQATHPDFQTDVSPYGLVHVRLSVPGQGTFETTTSAVRIRPYNPIRDRLEQSYGRRFFPIERTGRGG